MKKYELTEETITLNENQTLYRIKALKDFSDVKAGDLGGFVESEKNLSQDGDCWIYDEAIVYDSARIFASATIHDSARIFGSAKIFDFARIFGSARISDSWIYGSARIYGLARIS